MSWLGKVLSLPIRVVNAPIRAAENLIERACGGDDKMDDGDRVFSTPLDALKDEMERL